jgi:hypothetical protein
MPSSRSRLGPRRRHRVERYVRPARGIATEDWQYGHAYQGTAEGGVRQFGHKSDARCIREFDQRHGVRQPDRTIRVEGMADYRPAVERAIAGDGAPRDRIAQTAGAAA